MRLRRVLLAVQQEDLAEPLGFDSLFLTQASQAVRKRFGVKITYIVQDDSTTYRYRPGSSETRRGDAISSPRGR